MKHINILKNEIDRAGLQSVDRSFFSLSDPIRSKSRSDRIGQPSLSYINLLPKPMYLNLLRLYSLHNFSNISII